MKRPHVLALALLMWFPGLGESHTLDEYVQATRLDIFRERVVVELALTPGASLAAEVFRAIDLDRNGRISPQEIQDYADRVLHDLSLDVDGHSYPLVLARAESPSWDEIRSGEGTIQLNAFARVSLAPGSHIHYANTHYLNSGAVFLVNVLSPSPPDVVIRSQHRDFLQHDIDVEVDIATSFNQASWWLLPIAALAGLLVYRRSGQYQ